VDRAEPARQPDILQWMSESRDALRAPRYRTILDFDGVDAFDVLLSPIYATVLNTLRRGPAEPEPAARRAIRGARTLGYRVKLALREKRAARQSARPAPADIVLWSRDFTHSAILEPVAEALGRRGASGRVLACQVSVFEGFSRKSEAVYSLGGWPRIVHAARREGARRARELAALGPWSLPAMDHPRGPLLERVVRETVIRHLPGAAEAIANARAVFEKLQARVLVVGNDLTMEGRAGCLVGAARGVATAMFTHGSITPDALHRRHLADRILVCGQVHRDVLMRQGVEPERIVICGAPSLDSRPRQTGQIHPALASRLGLLPDRPWILVATSGPGHRISHRHHEQIVAGLLRLSATLSDVPVVVKLHPKDQMEYYRAGLQGGDARLLVVSTKDRELPRDILQWLQGCSLLLTGASASAVEAMLMDVPVITMDYCGETTGCEFIDAGATAHVRTPEALEAAAKAILAGGMSDDLRGRVQAYLRDSFFALDGGSAARGAAALCELAQRGSKTIGQTR
jgi:hypothetical protein